MVYGTCVTVATNDAKGGGCSAGTPRGRWIPLLPLFLGTMALIARRRTGRGHSTVDLDVNVHMDVDVDVDVDVPPALPTGPC
jgi:hypothetical protein